MAAIPAATINPGAAERASAYLLRQAEQQFAEVRHHMNFSHAAGFTGIAESQSSDIFARATLAHVLLDIAEFMPTTEGAGEYRALAEQTADYVAGAKARGRAGGWSYFPDLPELPPDADSLAAALSLFVRIAPRHIALCHEPVEIVLAGVRADGSFETWIVAPTDADSDRDRLQLAIQTFWGSGADPDVMAHFYYALWRWAPDRYEEVIRRGASKLIEMQQADGSWLATWYSGPAYGTGLAVRLLHKIGTGTESCARACRFLIENQQEDGSWGEESCSSLQTALSMTALWDAASASGSPDIAREAIARGAAALRARQLDDGSWPGSPWIKMEIGRAQQKILHVANYQSVTLTTAFCLRAGCLSETLIPD